MLDFCPTEGTPHMMISTPALQLHQTVTNEYHRRQRSPGTAPKGERTRPGTTEGPRRGLRHGAGVGGRTACAQSVRTRGENHGQEAPLCSLHSHEQIPQSPSQWVPLVAARVGRITRVDLEPRASHAPGSALGATPTAAVGALAVGVGMAVGAPTLGNLAGGPAVLDCCTAPARRTSIAPRS